jgi:predicted aldo/keto reductase-like oxidoreductase
MARGIYGLRLMGAMGPRADASLCVNCGKCVKACPQKIPIPDELKNVRRKLGGIRTKAMIPILRMVFSKKVEE